jgi:ParB-like chromosome segregation protein Spo0J
MRTTTVQLSTLVPDPENPRAHDKRNLDAIAASLRDHGQVEPLLVQKSSRMIIAGNGRAEAMRSLGWAEAHVVLLNVDDVQARKLSIQLNRTGELAGWDEAVLAQHLSDLSELEGAFDVSDLGFSGAEMDALLAAYITDVEPQAASAAQPTDDGAPAAAATGPWDGNSVGLPPGAAPVPMPASTVKVVQLFLSDATMGPFQMAVRKLAEQYGTDNITDTVQRAVLSAAGE